MLVSREHELSASESEARQSIHFHVLCGEQTLSSRYAVAGPLNGDDENIPAIQSQVGEQIGRHGPCAMSEPFEIPFCRFDVVPAVLGKSV